MVLFLPRSFPHSLPHHVGARGNSFGMFGDVPRTESWAPVTTEVLAESGTETKMDRLGYRNELTDLLVLLLLNSHVVSLLFLLFLNEYFAMEKLP